MCSFRLLWNEGPSFEFREDLRLDNPWSAMFEQNKEKKEKKPDEVREDIADLGEAGVNWIHAHMKDLTREEADPGNLLFRKQLFHLKILLPELGYR